MHIGDVGNNRSPELGRREVTHGRAGWRDAEGRFPTQLGGDRNRGSDIAVVEDLVVARTQELSEFDTGPTGIGSAEGSADVEGAVFAYGNGHAADLEAFELRSTRKISSTCG
jgi:hypothetical protein